MLGFSRRETPFEKKATYPFPINNPNLWQNSKKEDQPTACPYKDCPGQKQKFFQNGVPRTPQLHDKKHEYHECSIDNMKDIYFCNDITKDETIVKQCYQLYHNFCNVDTTTDDTTDNATQTTQ